MKKLLLFLLVALPLAAQVPSLNVSGTLTAASSDCSTAGSCVVLMMSPNSATVTVQIAGTYSGTNQFEGSPNDANYASVQCTSTADVTATATSTTSTGTWQCPSSGLAQFRVRQSTHSSGTANVYLQSSQGTARHQVPGTGTGTVTSIATTSPITGGTITTTGTIACATCVAATALTSTRVPFASAAHTLTDDADLTFTGGDTLNTENLVINGTCTGCGGGGISGSISPGQVAVGSGTDAIGGSAALTWTDSTKQLGLTVNGQAGTGGFTIAQGIYIYDANNVEMLRIVATDPDPTNSDYGIWNLYIGRLAGRDQTTNNTDSGYYNTGVGNQSLQSNTLGVGNSAFGSQSMQNNTGGQSNSAFGNVSLFANMAGSANAAFGVDTLWQSQGNNNTAFGYNAGNRITTGDGGVFIGYQAGPTTDQSNKLYINNSESDTPLIGGDFTSRTVSINGSLTGLRDDLTVNPIATPVITSVTPQTAGGGKTITYKTVTLGLNGHTAASAAVTTTDAANDLSAMDSGNALVLAANTADTGGTDIYRTASNAAGDSGTTGLIGHVGPGVLSYVDVGAAGDSASAPTTNTTGNVYAGSTGAWKDVHAANFVMESSALRTDTTDAHTGAIQGYDVDNTTYRNILSWTNGNAVAATLATPTGGSLLVDADSYKVGGVSGVTGCTAGVIKITAGIVIGVGVGVTC